ncbi:acetyl-CoA carboxylase biotin carboxyl carrier protein [Lactobacillaceae bacterium L1_55_11]|nr:acetyl-CoA carboxylase biotin carboxyl carrier protein [Lactobacillaceae bacterium L1_55_11]
MDLDINEIRALMADLEKSSLRDLDLQAGDFSLHLSKNENSVSPAANPAPAAQAPATAAAPANDSAAAPAPASQPAAPAPAGEEILAPMVGTVYLQPKPDAPAFKKVGDQINKGDVVAVIEAMKLMTEIHSEVTGTLTEILVSNEEVVDFDKPLFRVTPN